MSYSPVALFVYNRLDHAQITIASLAQNLLAGQTPLYIFSDGPKSDRDESLILKLRKYLSSVTGFKEVTIIEREKNAGLSKSITGGVEDIVHQHGRVIVLEDDHKTCPYFLKYMNDALDLYQDEEKVISIVGYTYPVGELPETYFMKSAESWGWATWKRGWELFDPDGSKLLETISKNNFEFRFNLDGSYPYIEMLRNQIAGKNDSWAIRWKASAFVNNKLSLYPGRSLLQNIGFDNTGTHCNDVDYFKVPLSDKPIDVVKIPLVENEIVRLQHVKFNKGIRRRERRRLLGKMLRDPMLFKEKIGQKICRVWGCQ